MPSSPTHNIVRLFQLILAISLVATASFLLHYRTKSHSNFTNEPLAMVVSGSVALVYAFYAVVNHRRQPDNHRWAYLHGICCLFVFALLIAGSTLGFILGGKGVLCDRLKEQTAAGTGVDILVLRNSSDNHDYDSNIIRGNAPHPDYHSGQQYDSTDICTNTYSDMDQACAVLGIVAALLWVLDFCLIFGFCGSSGRYGEHRNYYGGRGQFGPGDPEEDDIPAGGHTLPGGGAGGGGFGYYGEGHGGGGRQVRDDSFFDYTADPHRKRELELMENRTRDDPQRHVQGPIPLSMQRNYLSGLTTPTVSSISRTTAAAMAFSGDREDPHSLIGATLSPPPRPKVVPEPPDSPTLPSYSQKDKMVIAARGNTTPPISAGHSRNSTSLSRNSTSHSRNLTSLSRNSTSVKRAGKASTASSTPVPVIQEPNHSLAHGMPSQAVDQPAQDEALQDHVVAEEEEVPSSTSSPRYIEFPPGPACYVFDSGQHEYLPSFVNVAARIEQKYSLKHTSSHSSTGDGDDVATPDTATTSVLPLHVGTPRRVNSPRIVVTGLGFDVMSRDDAEIAAEEKEEEHQRQQRRQQVVDTPTFVFTDVSHSDGTCSPATVAAVTAAATSAAVHESPTPSVRSKTLRPPKLKLPKSESFGPISSSSTSTSSPVTPKAFNVHTSPTLLSPPILSRPSPPQFSPHPATEQPPQPQEVMGGDLSPTTAARPTLTKRRTNSKLAVVTPKKIQQQQQQPVAGSSVAGGRSTSPSALPSSTSLEDHSSDSEAASPRSPYVGDF